MHAILHITHSDGARDRVEWPADRDVLKIGRIGSCQVQLRGENAARLHAVLERNGDELMVVDLGSSSGTKVNEQHRHKALLADGDVLTFGDSTVRVEIPGWRPAPVGLYPTDRPAKVGACPRCEAPMQLFRSAPKGYRDAGIRFLRCAPCDVSAIESATLEARYGRAEVLVDSVAVRSREVVAELCPACIEDLERITLEWGERWVAIERCPACGCVVLDDGEGLTLDGLLAHLERRIGHGT